MSESIDAPARSQHVGAAIPAGFRAMMRGFPTGVAVVTVTDLAGRPWGMTCSSLCSVSLEPPTLLVCLRGASPTLAAVLARRAFSVNLLHEESRETAELFASGDPRRFDGVSWCQHDRDLGPHLWADTHAVADCRLRDTVPVGDHVVVFGEVVRVVRSAHCRPLLYGMRRYSGWPLS